MNTARSEDSPVYGPDSNRAGIDLTDDEIIAAALRVIESRMRKGMTFDSPAALKGYLRVRYAQLEHETFCVTFVDSQYRLIAHEEMFRGTTNQASVYPREIAKRALQLNASAVFLSHNHPSGDPKPSRADEMLTSTIKASLALIDVRVLDHVAVGAGGTVSLAEAGLL